MTETERRGASSTTTPKRLPAAGQEARARGGPPWMRAGMPAEKSLNFGPSAKRLLRRLYPERYLALAVLGLAVGSVTLAVLGPRLLGRATDVIFRGFLGDRLPSGVPLSRVVDAARARGDDTYAGLLQSVHVVPGRGIDFGELREVLLLAVLVYLVGNVLAALQGFVLNGVVQRTVQRLRADVEDKLNRLPLAYFDRQPRGEILSRVTNDIDNIAQTLAQTMSQLLTALLTLIGVLTMMFVLSPLLAVIALVTIPLSFFVTK
ncbi:MAG TPA: ABC transporter transmembrane domain-containing protein, partial [Jatrophihabitans sp.]|nr:ABC transporter transmembrane domain-containing protein [Jatrophihabitans sp.]